ncbi:hypothetical protein [Bacillus sp. JJ1764]|uniref:hypothetical protein n=1 Tax=Bacillus sp. JJ1764 TaxID=3122964 RepID=UPI002FFE49C1
MKISIHEMYLNNINAIEQLLNLEIEDLKAQEALNKMLFSNVMTAITLSDPPYLLKILLKLIQSLKKKFNLSEIFTIHYSIKDIMVDYLLDIIYHNINVSFPENLNDIQKMIMIRHDIVHRNGKSKQSSKINIDKEIVIKSITIINNLIERIDNEIKIINKFSHNPVVKRSLAAQL